MDPGTQNPPIAWLLLREGHSVPIYGISPERLKEVHPGLRAQGVEMKPTTCYNATVDCLGFKGDFGTYKNEHWPRLREFMRDHDLALYRNLFDVPSNDLAFGIMKFKRRALADRLTFGDGPLPRRIFLGCQYDWDQWDKLFFTPQMPWTRRDESYTPATVEDAARWVYWHRGFLQGAPNNFIGDQLVDTARPGDYVYLMYRPADLAAKGAPSASANPANVDRLVRALRLVLDQDRAGWVDVVPCPWSPNLFFLRGLNGAYDLVWRDLRDAPPPSDDEFTVWNYRRHGVWDEKEQHEAETYYYETAGRTGELLYPGVEAIMKWYLAEKGIYVKPASAPANQ